VGWNFSEKRVIAAKTNWARYFNLFTFIFAFGLAVAYKLSGA
jgi:hypothetical protein